MIRVAFIGDVIGRPGRTIISQHLKSLRDEFKIDFVVSNGENISHGFGITAKNANELFRVGVDLFTGGNHSWDKKEIIQYLDTLPIIRPLNYPIGVAGSGIFKGNIRGEKFAIINLMGIYSMPMVDNPFRLIQKAIDELKNEQIKNIFIDFHAEATSEKRALCMMLQGNISGIVGTHTHIGTDDLDIFNGMAYVSDIGLTGCYDSVIGMNKESALGRFLTAMPIKFEIQNECKKILQMVVLDTQDGVCKKAFKLKLFDNEKPKITMEINV